MTTSIITGVTGQDGSYLAELLLSKGEKVVGFSRRTAVHSTSRIDHLMNDPNFTYLEGDLTDQQFIWKLISDYKPNKYFNLGAQSHVHTSFTNPGSTIDIDLLGVLRVLEAIRTLNPETRFYQASTSEMFGSSFSIMLPKERKNFTSEIKPFKYVDDSMDSLPFQDENTPMVPNSPYAIAKLAAHNLVRLYRDSYGLKCCSGILFNHESPRRGENFVTQKIMKWIVSYLKWKEYNESLEENKNCYYECIKDNITLLRSNPDNKPYPDKACWLFGPSFPKLRLGNLDTSRDWGHAKDYVKAMDMMISADVMNDYVVGTGETHTIREFLDEAFNLIGIKDWSNYVVVDPKFMRPSEVPYLCSDPSKIQKELGWKSEVTFKELVKDMYETELRRSTIY